jgi:hypothetical protein
VSGSSRYLSKLSAKLSDLFGDQQIAILGYLFSNLIDLVNRAVELESFVAHIHP